MLRLLKLALFIGVFSAPAMAQVATAELSGNVFDGSGAAVANAKVTVTNVDTNRTFEAVSNSTGGYFIQLLPPGTYNVTVEAPNFRQLPSVPT